MILLQPTLFKSSVLIYIDPKFDQILRFEKFDGGSPSDLDALSSLQIMIVADSMVLRVVDKLGLREEEGFLPPELAEKAHLPDKQLVSFLQKERFSAELIEGTRLIKIVIHDPDPDRAQRIASGFASGFDEFLVDQRQAEAKRARAQIETQAAEAKKIALGAEAKLREFRESHPQYPVEQDHDMFAARLTQFSSDLNTVESQRMDLETQVEYLSNIDPDTSPLAIFKVSGTESLQPISDILRLRADSDSKLAAAREEMVPTNHRYRAILSEHEKHLEQLREMASEIKLAVSSKLDATRRREDSLRTQLDEIQRQLIDVKSLSSEFRALNQQAERDWLVYENLQNRLSDSVVAMDTHGSIATEVSEPMTPYKKSGPSKLILLLIACSLGALLSLSWVGSRVLLGLPYTDCSQLERRFQLPVIAGSNSATSGRDAVFLHSLGVHDSKILHMYAPNRPGPGKSFATMAANMAAQAGGNTLLVVLGTDGEAAPTPRPTDTPKLMRLDASAESAIQNRALELYLKAHQERFRHIFIEAGDCEDTGIVRWLSTLAEKNVVVVERGVAMKQAVDEAVEDLSAAGMPPVGIVLVEPESCRPSARDKDPGETGLASTNPSYALS